MVFETLHVRVGIHALGREGKPHVDEAGVQITAPFVIPVVKPSSANGRATELDVHAVGRAARTMLESVLADEGAPSKKRFLELLSTRGSQFRLRRRDWDKHGQEAVALGYVRIEVEGVAHRLRPGPGPEAHADPTPGTQDGKPSGSAARRAAKGGRP